MLNWFRSPPRCPVDEQTKEWIESRFNWLEQELGLEQLTDGPTLTPTPEYLPFDFQCTEPHIRELMQRVATYMGFDTDLLELGFYHDYSSAGLCIPEDEKFHIYIDDGAFEFPEAVLATLTQQIAHAILLSEDRVSIDEPDREELAALLSVYLGVGLFQANAVVLETSESAPSWYQYRMSRRGFFTMEMFGYSLALYALARNEPKPEWTRHLRPDVRGAFKLGVRYIQKTGDCAFAPAAAVFERDRSEMQEAGE